ncbi:hypothetical protein FH972_024919 [Carpinus fangiana]|uniref:Uncharacterized protein n=1 Tax=Carpinus fangiana TaxID=176857 RepID=A0A5N6KZH5_9ROSI|nr:hypothetical protein FH972_024919 [Carpinus fangiana]
MESAKHGHPARAVHVEPCNVQEGHADAYGQGKSKWGHGRQTRQGGAAPPPNQMKREESARHPASAHLLAHTCPPRGRRASLEQQWAIVGLDSGPPVFQGPRIWRHWIGRRRTRRLRGV